MHRLLICLTLIVLAASLSPAFGQASDGNITGTILDASGAVVPRAAVELENVATGVKRTTESDQAGVYTFQNVLVGRYRVTARASGFTASVLENIVVNLNRTTTANFSLTVGQVSTQVEVVEAATLIDTRTATIGSSFGSQEAIYNPASSLPLGVYNLALLSAGVASSGGTGLGEGPSVGGQRPRQNSFTIEGVDNNRKDVTGANIRVPNE
ncbi:MAG TPA: carboxypeptidase-like regulatory domain-containing protein, partial [Bryobacteraceae bacterium]|nr:carboxypeptidase-like regulatory domain-containing protein [Bryobacteraceae bacterium]